MAVPESDEKTRKSIERILQIWEERGVYEPKLIKEFRRGLGTYQTTLYILYYKMWNACSIDLQILEYHLWNLFACDAA
jgi:hypothetical protein